MSDGTRRYGRSAALLTGAVGTAGILTYAFFALASHALDRDEYGQIVVLWSAMFVAIAVLFRPVEQLLSRTVAELESHGRPTAHVLRVAAAIQLGVAGLFVIVAFALRDELQNDLFEGDELFFYALIASVLGWAATFYCRGYLAGSGRFGLYAVLILADAVARMTFALVVAVGIADGADPVALGIALAPALSLVVMPLALRPKPPRGTVDPDAIADAEAMESATLVAEAAPEFTLARGSGFASAVLVIMLSEQVLINSGPLFARAEVGTAAAAGFIFNVLMVARAPVVLFQAVATSLLPHLTRLRSNAEESAGAAFRRSVAITIQAIAGFAALTMLTMLVAGPELMQAAFGDKFEYDRTGLVIVAGGMGLYLVATTLTQAVLATGLAGRAAGGWAICGIAFVVWNLLPVLEVFRRVEIGFAAAAALLCALLYAMHRAGQPARG